MAGPWYTGNQGSNYYHEAMNIMTIKELEAIYDEEAGYVEGDSIFQGLEILARYAGGKRVIQAAEHDEIYSLRIEDVLEAGLTRGDAVDLRDFGWNISGGEGFQHFV